MGIVSDLIIHDLKNGDKLTEENYNIWSRKIQYLLEDQELLEPLTNNVQPPSTDSGTHTKQYQRDLESYNTWKKKTRVARNILLSSMTDDLILRFDHHETAKDVWDAVKLSLDKTILMVRKQVVKNKIHPDDVTKRAHEIAAEHIASMTNMIRDSVSALIQAMIKPILDDQGWDS